MHFGQVVPKHAEESVAENGCEGFHQGASPCQGEQQDWGQQQVGHQKPQDEANSSAYEQVGRHGPHLLHQLLTQSPEHQTGHDANARARGGEPETHPLGIHVIE